MLGQRRRRWANINPEWVDVQRLLDFRVHMAVQFKMSPLERGRGALVERLTASPVMHASRVPAL